MRADVTKRRRVVITGMGIVSAAGSDLDTFWRRLVAGQSAVRRISRFDPSAFPSQVAAEIDDVDFRTQSNLPAEWAQRGRVAQFAALAAERALNDSGARASSSPNRTGIILATGHGSHSHAELVGPAETVRRTGPDAFEWRSLAAELRRLLQARSAERLTPGSVPTLLAQHYGFTGPVMSVMTACAGATQALGDAIRWIRRGDVDRVVAGGADSELSPMGLASFCLLGALSRRSNHDPAAASRPFDARRDGFVIGEGAGVLVLEERHHALARGAQVYAEIAGFGSASDAYRVTDPHPDGVGARLAITRALDNAGVRPALVDYINAHGTSTPANDRIETLAIKSVFGDRSRAIPISSTKSLIGHATVAAGAMEAIATALTLSRQVLHPTINQDEPDAACDLDYVPNRARPAAVEIALSNSFAFGGQSAALVFQRHHDDGR